MTRTYVRRRWTVAVAVVVVVGILVSAPVAGALGRHERSEARRGRTSQRVYVVRPGDTVWSIAERASGGGDPRSLVDAIAARNGIDAGSIVPGQALVIPSSG